MTKAVDGLVLTIANMNQVSNLNRTERNLALLVNLDSATARKANTDDRIDRLNTATVIIELIVHAYMGSGRYVHSRNAFQLQTFPNHPQGTQN